MQPHGHSYFINAFDNDWLHKTSLQLKHDIGYYFVTLTLPDFSFRLWLYVFLDSHL